MKLWLFCLFLTLFFPFFGFAASLDDALERAAIYFQGKLEGVSSDKRLLIEVVNLHSRDKDEQAKRMTNLYYIALDNRFPKGRVVLPNESLTGYSLNKAVLMKGEYEQRGASTYIRFTAVDNFNGEILGSTEEVFSTEKQVQRGLVVVLDLESDSLNKTQRLILSKIFRAAVAEHSGFNILSSNQIEKFNPEQIQKAYNCTREKCAVIIGEQLGVDRVIFSNYLKFSTGLYFLSATVVDIKTEAVVSSKQLKHDGSFENISDKMNELAKALMGTSKATIRPAPAAYQPPPLPKPKADLSAVTIDEKTGLMWQDNDHQERHEWQSAMFYCDKLTLSGFSDWRLPNKDELETLYDHREILKSYESSYYWSSTAYASYTAYAWRAYFNGGYVSYGYKAYSNYVRCVRGGR